VTARSHLSLCKGGRACTTGFGSNPLLRRSQPTCGPALVSTKDVCHVHIVHAHDHLAHHLAPPLPAPNPGNPGNCSPSQGIAIQGIAHDHLAPPLPAELMTPQRAMPSREDPSSRAARASVSHQQSVRGSGCSDPLAHSGPQRRRVRACSGLTRELSAELPILALHALQL